MKNFVLILMFMIFAQPCFAGGVGYINYEKVVMNYKFANSAMKEIEAKNNEVRQYLLKKEEEFNKIESPLQKKKFEEGVQNELKTKEKEFNSLREKREEEVYTKIHAVAEKIRLEKGLDALLDARSVFSGGVDITDELILKLNSTVKR